MASMRSQFKIVPTQAVLAAALASLAGCGSMAPGGWMLDAAERSEDAERYADFVSARYASLSDDVGAGAVHARRALEGDPTNPTLLDRAVVASLLAGETEAAADLAVQAKPEQLASAPFANLTRVVEDITSDRPKQALDRLRKGGLPRGEVGVYLEAWLAAPADIDAAVAKLTTGAAASQGRPAAQADAIAGLVLASRGRSEAALVRFERAWSRGDHTPEATAAYVRLLSASDAARARKVVADFRAEAGYDPGVEAAADGRAFKPLSAREGAAQVLMTIGRTTSVRSRPELASLYFSLALRIQPDLAPARIALADSLRRQDRLDDALATLAPIGRGALFSAQANMAEAFIREALEDNEGAQRAAQQALAQARARDLLVQAGDLARTQQRHAEAEALYNEAQKLDAAAGRADWRIYFARGAERERLGRWADAEADLKRALELEPDRPELLNFLGYAWVQRGGDVRGGLDLIERALARRPNEGYIVDSLGWAHYRLGDYDEAVRQLERAAELEPSDPEINDHLGDAYWRVGRRQDAGYSWSRAVQLDPPEELAASLKQKLESGLLDQPRPRALAGAAEPNRP